MTPAAIQHVRETWALAAASPDATARLFYANLFRIAPSTKPLFVGDMEMQGRKLTSTLNFVVQSLDDLESLVPAAEDLARRHLDYGVTEEQYGSVGEALIATLAQMLGPMFTSQARDSWVAVYGVLQKVMVKAAYHPG